MGIGLLLIVLGGWLMYEAGDMMIAADMYGKYSRGEPIDEFFPGPISAITRFYLERKSKNPQRQPYRS